MTELALIRPYAPGDAVSCRRCIVELQEAERRIDPRLRRGEEMADAYLQLMHVHCQEYAGVILVDEAASEVAGLTMVLTHVPFESLDEPPGAYALVAELVVRDAYRRRDTGASELRIGVLSGNHGARQLYERLRFTPYVETLSQPLT